jgi:glycosyltransferase involved in cell wall biosynthesis
MPRASYDVVFYTPGMGPLFRPGAARPPGGAETQFFLLSRLLARRGFKVAVICYNVPGGLPDEFEGVRVITRGPPYRAHSPLTGKIKEALRVWRALWRVRAAVIVKRTSGVDAGIVGVYARLVRARYVFSSANIMDFMPRQIHLPKARDTYLYKLGVRLADRIVVQTDEQVGMCEEFCGRTPEVIKSIVEMPGERHPALPEAFLWIGRLVPYKKPLEYVELARSVPDLRFQILAVPFDEHEYGKTLRDAIEAAATELPNLEIVEPRSREALGELMEHAVAIVNTADHEGMPNIFLEGWARGIPSLALTHDPDEVIQRHRLGGFARGSKAELTRLASELWRTREDREELSRRCISYVTRYHGADTVADAWIRAFSRTEPKLPRQLFSQALTNQAL